MEPKLEDRLREVGSKLASPPSAVNKLLPLLDRAESLLSRVDQSPKHSMSNALRPSMRALVSKELLGHSDLDVKVAVLSCLSEITRITAPEVPYEDELMKELFQKIVEAFENLDDISGRSFPKRVSILETLAKVRSCVVMLDLGCDSDILEMFRHFFKTIRPNHSEMIFSSMETIMTLVLEENEDISSELLLCLLDSVKSDNNEILPVVRKLGEKVISNCAGKLKPYLVELSQSVGTSLNEYGEVVASICQQHSDSLEQNGLNIMGDDSKQSERTVSDEMRWGSNDMEREVGCPVEVTSIKKSPEPVMSNGNVQVHNDVSTPEPSSPKQKPEPSPYDDQYKKATAADRDASDSGSVKDSLPAEPEVPSATQPEQSRSRLEMAAKRHGGGAVGERSASALQDKQSETGDQAFSSQKESDDTGDSGCIVEPASVTISPEDKPQRQRGRNGSLSKTEHVGSSQKSRISKTKQENLKAKNDGAGEPFLKELISKSATRVPKNQGSLQDTPKIKSKKKLDPIVKEELIPKSATKVPKEGNSEDNSKTKSKKKVDNVAKEISETSKELDGSLVGCRIRVWWPIDKKFYDGKIDSYDHSSKKHKIAYNDGDVEILLLKKERWEFIKDDNESGKKQAEGFGSPDAVSGEPKSKRRKASPSSIPDETNTKTTAKSRRRAGRPPRAGPASTDDNPSSSSKVNEKADNEARDGNSISGTKIEDDPKSKDDISKAKSSSQVENELKNNSSKNSKQRTPNRSKDNAVGDKSKAAKGTLKRKTTDESPRTGKKFRGSTTPKTDGEAKVNPGSDDLPRTRRKFKGSATAKAGSEAETDNASEKGKTKVRSGAATKATGRKEAKKPAGKRRKRKG